ncbi:MAG TPA: selenium-binding protein SBP56-related protein [Nevskiaceae bacterium]|nr:selenium-binding protein SBP56-related protein [Nevskiaceae bacterium]
MATAHAGHTMADPTFYPSAADAAAAPREKLCYVALLKPDAVATVDLDPDSSSYGTVVNTWDAPHQASEDEFHHFGWNICSSALGGSHHHTGVMERRYLVMPGLRSSRIYILDTGKDPRHPELVRTIEPEEVIGKSGYSRPHTVHCGPDGLLVSAIGDDSADGSQKRAGIFMMDHDDFSVKGPWELDHGPQEMAYDFWWHSNDNVLMASEWGRPRDIENGVVPEALLGGRYGHRIHFFDMGTRRHIQEIDLGPGYQMSLEVRPSHDPTKTFGFMGVVINTTDLSGSVWTWWKEGGKFTARETIKIPAIKMAADKLPPLLKGFGAVPPIITDIGLSLDDHYLYVSCWATGQLLQYDVSDPLHPRQSGLVEIGGIGRGIKHPSGKVFAGGPQMIEISRDGKRVYSTNSLFRAWDDQFYPAGMPGAMVKVDVNTGGGLTTDPDFFVEFPGYRAHQVRLQGGDCSTDSFCFAKPFPKQ